MIRWDFPGILTDLIGDLQLTPDPIEIKLFSPDLKWLEQTAPRVEEQIKKIPGVVDTFDGLTETGPSINLRVRPADAARFGLTRAGHCRRREHRAARPDRVVCARRRPRRQHPRAGRADERQPHRRAARIADCARPAARSCGWTKWPT